MTRCRVSLRLAMFSMACASFLVLSADAKQPSPRYFSPRSGPPTGPPARPEILWSQPFDLNGTKVSSEIIGEYGLESRIADDFILGGDATIATVRAWGGYYNWTEGDPPIQALNIHFYADYGCDPGTFPLEVHLHLPLDETFVCYDGFGYPTYKYEIASSFSALAGVRYWLMVQADDHGFPPQWGRQQALEERDCPAMYYSVWPWPNWIPVEDLIGEPFDASFELESPLPVPTQHDSWGKVKALFRG